MEQLIFINSAFAKDSGLLLIRLGVGSVFVYHGYLKIVGGYEEILWHGQQMKNLGITFWPFFWGLCATISEFLGGISLILGLFTRPAAILMAFTMFVATIHHMAKKDPWGYISSPLALFFVFVGLAFSGAGSFSLDNYFFLV